MDRCYHNLAPAGGGMFQLVVLPAFSRLKMLFSLITVEVEVLTLLFHV